MGVKSSTVAPDRFAAALHSVAERFDLPASLLLAPTRRKDVVLARRTLIRELLASNDFSYAAIAARMACDQSTIWYHAADRTEKQKAMRARDAARGIRKSR